MTVVANFTAFYDANVLYPAELRNLLMHLHPLNVAPSSLISWNNQTNDTHQVEFDDGTVL